MKNRKRLLFGVGLPCNVLLPWLSYRVSEPHIGEAHAIMISAVVPLAWSLFEFARNRKVDVISILVLSGIALSLIAIAFGGSPRLLLFRESLVTGLIGLVMIVHRRRAAERVVCESPRRTGILCGQSVVPADHVRDDGRSRQVIRCRDGRPIRADLHAADGEGYFARSRR
jgi:hypothetical protein